MKLPEGWKKVELRECFSRLVRKNDEGNTNVLTISAQHGLISQEKFFNKSIASEDKSNYFLLEKGDFAYNKSYSAGYPFGAIKSLEKYEKGIVSPLYICFKKTADNKCPEYFLHYFEAGLANNEICAIAQEGARNHGLLNISTDDFFKIKILLPPLPEQQKIAEILSTQDKVIELKENLLEQKQTQKKFLLRILLDEKLDAIISQNGWKFVKLGEICQKIGSGSTPKGGRKVYLDSGIPIIRSQNVLNGILDMNDVAYISKEQHQKMKGTWVYPNDILLNITGASIGRSCVVPEDIQTANVNQHVCIIRLKNGVNSIFVCDIILSDKFQKQIQLLSAGGGRQGLNFQQIASFKIFLPPLPEQQAIAEVLSTADKEIDLLKSEIEQEKLKKKALMQLLLTGIVRVKVNE